MMQANNHNKTKFQEWTHKFWHILKREKFYYQQKIVVIMFLLALFFLERFLSINLRNAFTWYNWHGNIIISGFLNITPVYNVGIAFNLLNNNLIGVIFLELFFSILSFVIFTITSNKWISAGIGLMFVGSVSNFLQHVFFGNAFDFIEIVPLHIICNTADIFVTIGLIIAILAFTFSESQTFKMMKPKIHNVDGEIKVENDNKLNIKTAKVKKFKINFVKFWKSKK